MKPNTYATCSAAIVLSALFSGCESAPKPKAASPASSSKSAPLATAAPKRQSKSPIDSIAFNAPKPVEPEAPSDNVQRMTMIGMFGELDGMPRNGGLPFDGDSNLAQISFANEGACIDPDIDRTGAWIAFASTMHRRTSDIYLKSVTGKTLTQITTDPADDAMPAFSSDGKTLAFASNRAGNWDIYATSIGETGRCVQITNDADHELHPSWSPDGKMIAYCKFGAQSSRWEIWVTDATNPGIRHFLDYGVFPQWCPDPARGKLLFQRAKQRGSRDYSVWTIDFINGQALNPTEIVSAANAALINPAWSPDGSRIVFVSVVNPDQSPQGRPNQSDLWIVNVDGSGRTNLTNGQFANFQPVWAADGNVYFVSDRSGVDNVWSVNTRTALARSSTGVASAESAGMNRDSRP